MHHLEKFFWQWDDLSAALVKNGPLDFPSEKKFSFNFAHEKGLVVLEFSFFCVATSQKWFLARTPLWTAIESVNFKNFVQHAATATM